MQIDFSLIKNIDFSSFENIIFFVIILILFLVVVIIIFAILFELFHLANKLIKRPASVQKVSNIIKEQKIIKDDSERKTTEMRPATDFSYGVRSAEKEKKVTTQTTKEKEQKSIADQLDKLKAVKPDNPQAGGIESKMPSRNKDDGNNAKIVIPTVRGSSNNEPVKPKEVTKKGDINVEKIVIPTAQKNSSGQPTVSAIKKKNIIKSFKKIISGEIGKSDMVNTVGQPTQASQVNQTSQVSRASQVGQTSQVSRAGQVGQTRDFSRGSIKSVGQNAEYKALVGVLEDSEKQKSINETMSPKNVGDGTIFNGKSEISRKELRYKLWKDPKMFKAAKETLLYLTPMERVRLEKNLMPMAYGLNISKSDIKVRMHKLSRKMLSEKDPKEKSILRKEIKFVKKISGIK